MERALRINQNNISLPSVKNANWNKRSDKTEYSVRMLQIQRLVERYDLFTAQDLITSNNLSVYRSSIFGYVEDLIKIRVGRIPILSF